MYVFFMWHLITFSDVDQIETNLDQWYQEIVWIINAFVHTNEVPFKFMRNINARWTG